MSLVSVGTERIWLRQSIRDGEKILSRLGNLRVNDKASRVMDKRACLSIDRTHLCWGDLAAAHIMREMGGGQGKCCKPQAARV